MQALLIAILAVVASAAAASPQAPATGSDAVRLVDERLKQEDWAGVAELVDKTALEWIRMDEICSARHLAMPVDEAAAARLRALYPDIPIPRRDPEEQARLLREVYQVGTLEELEALGTDELFVRRLSSQVTERTARMDEFRRAYAEQVATDSGAAPDEVESALQFLEQMQSSGFDVIGEVERSDTAFVLMREPDGVGTLDVITTVRTGGGWRVIPELPLFPMITPRSQPECR